MILQVLSQFITCIACIFLHGDEETKPRGLRVLLGLGKEKTLHTLQTVIHRLIVLSSALHNEVELLQLGTANSCLKICGFEVIAQMTINIFMVIALRQLTKLTSKATTTGIIHTTYAPAVTAPVTITVDILVQFRIIGIDSTTLAHRHVVRRIE